MQKATRVASQLGCAPLCGQCDRFIAWVGKMQRRIEKTVAYVRSKRGAINPHTTRTMIAPTIALCTGVLESPRPFRPLCLCPENSVSPQWRLRFEETGSNAMSVRAAPSPTALSPRVEHPGLLQARPAEACRGASHDGDDSAIMTALPEEQLMPLSRSNDGFEIELEGIAFGMVDRQGHRWRCLITDRV